jgi:hypothetical protein
MSWSGEIRTFQLRTPNAQRPILKAHSVCASSLDVGRWTLDVGRWMLSHAHNRTLCSRNAFPTTDTELKLIASPASIGLIKIPKNG